MPVGNLGARDTDCKPPAHDVAQDIRAYFSDKVPYLVDQDMIGDTLNQTESIPARVYCVKDKPDKVSAHNDYLAQVYPLGLGMPRIAMVQLPGCTYLVAVDKNYFDQVYPPGLDLPGIAYDQNLPDYLPSFDVGKAGVALVQEYSD